jgi:ubiquinone/menaquinone biosynthesis C-methylase UbiE
MQDDRAMRANALNYLVCPREHSRLTLVSTAAAPGGTLRSESGREYAITEGIPVLLVLDDIPKNRYAQSLFGRVANTYDQYHHLSFETFCQQEEDVRHSLIDRLALPHDACILELGAGTGRDSILIRQQMKAGSTLHVQDISLDMLTHLKKRFTDDDPVVITQSNACVLPYPDKLFDAIYSFGSAGMDVYADSRALFKEIVRVAKPGAKVVTGGLSLAPWLYQSEFGKILRNHNPHYENRLSLENLPIEARDVRLSWILNGAGFCLEFTVGEGEPPADFDFPIPGERGGTLRTRYYGRLEGVSPDAVRLAEEARKKSGKNMHQWLDEVIRQAASKELGRK